MTAEIIPFPFNTLRAPPKAPHNEESAAILILPVDRAVWRMLEPLLEPPIVSPETEARVRAMFKQLGIPIPYW